MDFALEVHEVMYGRVSALELSRVIEGLIYPWLPVLLSS